MEPIERWQTNRDLEKEIYNNSILKTPTSIACLACLDLMCAAIPEFDVSLEVHPTFPRRTSLLQCRHLTSRKSPKSWKMMETSKIDKYHLQPSQSGPTTSCEACLFQAFQKDNRQAVSEPFCNRQFYIFWICLLKNKNIISMRSTPFQCNPIWTVVLLTSRIIFLW